MGEQNASGEDGRARWFERVSVLVFFRVIIGLSLVPEKERSTKSHEIHEHKTVPLRVFRGSSYQLPRKSVRASRSVRTGRPRSWLFEPDGDQLGDADFFHRHAVKSARGFHCAFVVRDDDELSVG